MEKVSNKMSMDFTNDFEPREYRNVYVKQNET